MTTLGDDTWVITVDSKNLSIALGQWMSRLLLPRAWKSWSELRTWNFHFQKQTCLDELSVPSRSERSEHLPEIRRLKGKARSDPGKQLVSEQLAMEDTMSHPKETNA